MKNNYETRNTMIVPSMNSQELYSGIMNDHRIVERKAYYLALGLRRPALKSKHKHVREIFDYQTKQRNNWIIIIDCYKKGYESSTTLYYLDQHGLNGVCVNSDDLTLSHFTPHFLKRYNERFLKDSKLSKLDLLKNFLVQNQLGAIEEFEDSESKKYEFFSRFKEGVGLGFKDVISDEGRAILHFKTFISNEMIFNCQRDGFNLLGEYYNEIYGQLQRINKRRA